jgi:hypothetical protein
MRTIIQLATVYNLILNIPEILVVWGMKYEDKQTGMSDHSLHVHFIQFVRKTEVEYKI